MKVNRLKFISCITMFLLLLLSGIVIADENIEKDILKIRKWYQEVESKVNSCRVIEKDGHTSYYAYLDPQTNQIVKIDSNVADDWYSQYCSYYFHNGELFFIFIEHYNGEEMYTAEELGITEQQLWEAGGAAKTHRFSQNRIYVKNEQCIRYLMREKTVPVSITDPKINEVKDKEKSPGNAESEIETGIELLKEFTRK